MTSIEYAMATKSMESVKWLFLYHKEQLYRFVQDQIKHPERVAQDATMAAIAAICAAEVSVSLLFLPSIQTRISDANHLRQSSIGNLAVAQHHALGLGRIAAIRARQVGQAYGKPTLSWRLVTM